MNDAQKYAEDIIANLLMMEEIDTDWWKNDVETTVDRLREASSPDPDEAARFDLMASWLENEFDSRDEDMGFAYLNSALDTWAEVEWRYNRTDVMGARVLLTIGGPHLEIVCNGGGDEVTVEATWGGDTFRRTVDCGSLARALNVVMENAEMALRS